jgi:hypothetical protein
MLACADEVGHANAYYAMLSTKIPPIAFPAGYLTMLVDEPFFAKGNVCSFWNHLSS